MIQRLPKDKSQLARDMETKMQAIPINLRHQNEQNREHTYVQRVNYTYVRRVNYTHVQRVMHFKS